MKKVLSLLKQVFFFLVVPGAVYLFFSILRPDVFLNWSSLYTIALSSCITIILAWGISFSLMAGIVDFSVASERVLGAVVGVLLSRSMGIWGLIVGSLVTAILFGVVKAGLNACIKVSSMVISVAYCYIIGSIGALVQGNNSMILTSDMCILGKSPYIWIIFALCGVVIYILQRYSVFGAHCRALGGNGKISAEAGISKGKTEGLAIFVASIFAGVSGVLATSYGAGTVAETGLASMGTIFPAIIGFNIGAMLSKYINITFGCVAGVLTMNILATGLVSLNIPSQLKDTATGLFLIFLLCLTTIMERRHAETLRRQASNMADLSAEKPVDAKA